MANRLPAYGLLLAASILLSACGASGPSAQPTPSLPTAGAASLVDVSEGYGAQWTRDGRIVYVGEGGIWEMDGAGREQRRILDFDYDGVGLLVSPDRSKMLVMHGENWIAKVDGNGFRPVADVVPSSSAHWSDDGSMVTFARHDGEEASLWAVPAEGGKPQLLFPDFGGFVLAWSPDGRMVVRAHHLPGGARTYFVEPGRPPIDLLEPNTTLREARFRPDGSIEGIKAEGGGGMVVVYPKTRETTPFPSPGRIRSLPDHAPHDSLVVYETDQGVWLARPDGSDARKLTSETCVSPSFSPDGSRIVCSHIAYTGGEDEYGHPLSERRIAIIDVPSAS